MANENERKNALDMIYLSGCVLNRKKPDINRISQMDLDSLYKMCKFHSLTAIVCSALELSGTETSAKWKEAKAKSIKKNMLLDCQRQDLFRFMDKKHIWHMPMKGIILKDLYPQLGMRQMSDNDILYDISFRKEVREYFVDQGYDIKSFGKLKDDVFQKPPVYNFEMHVALFGQEDNTMPNSSQLMNYYKNVKDRLIRDSNDNFLYHFSDEDFYIYFILHAYKHYDIAGTGIRSLIDAYLLLKYKSKSLDMEYVSSEIKSLGVSEFEYVLRSLSMKIFDDPQCSLSETESKMLNQFIDSGTYGTIDICARNKRKKYIDNTGNTGKAGYVLRRIFPHMETYKASFPFFYKHKILLPVGWFCRLVRAVLQKNRRVKWLVEIRTSARDDNN